VRVVLAIIIIVLVIIVVIAIVIAIAVYLQRRSARRAAELFGDADEIVRRWGDDSRPTRRLERLVDDPRTPSSARKHLDRLVRYRLSPIVLAPDWVPVLGWFNEGTIESFLLRQAFKTLPPELWAEYFPSTVPATSPVRAASSSDSGQPREPQTFAVRLAELDRAGNYPELLRLLDRRMPPWPVGASLIEVAREIVELERNVATARTSSVPEAVTSRLAAESRTAAGALWDLADRVVTAASYGIETERMTDHLDCENAKLLELRAAIREARTGLAELTLSGGGRSGDVDRAERRFRALAATAEELQEMDKI
jgi:uncharacterized membrane protein YkvA (DUF1232 family)